MSASSSELIAAKAIAAFTNDCACSTATGAWYWAVRARPLKKRRRLTSGSARARATGRRLVNSGSSSAITSFSEEPRDAKALP